MPSQHNLIDASQIVDCQRYPLADPNSPRAQHFAAQCRAEYQTHGLCRLPGFIAPEVLPFLAAECADAGMHAYFCDDTHNAYLTVPDDNWTTDDVRHSQERTFVGSVAYDHIPEQALLRRLYRWAPLKTFIARVLDKPALYHFADPLGACSINVFTDGGAHGWHFDESEFTITLMVQASQIGGAFEYVPCIRGTSDEERIVAQVLAGDRDRVSQLPFDAGTLLIFGGRQTLHRVTETRGQTPRLVPVLCYSEQPNQMNSQAVRELFWGRPGPN